MAPRNASQAKPATRRATIVPSVRRYPGSGEIVRPTGLRVSAPAHPVEFTVSAKPVSSNATYRRGRGSGFYKTREANEYHNAVRQAGQVAMRGAMPFDGPVEVGRLPLRNSSLFANGGPMTFGDLVAIRLAALEPFESVAVVIGFVSVGLLLVCAIGWLGEKP